jgi:hypothetical protein
MRNQKIAQGSQGSQNDQKPALLQNPEPRYPQIQCFQQKEEARIQVRSGLCRNSHKNCASLKPAKLAFATITAKRLPTRQQVTRHICANGLS